MSHRLSGWNKTEPDPSLLARIRKGQVGYPPEVSAEVWNGICARAVHHDTIHVRFDSLFAGIFKKERTIHLRDDLEDVTPPYSSLWMEAFIPSGSLRVGFLVERSDCAAGLRFHDGDLMKTFVGPPYKHWVRMWMFGGNCATSDWRGLPAGYLTLVTDECGQLAGYEGADYLPQDGNAGVKHTTAFNTTFRMFLGALEAIVWMNTRGTKLVMGDDKGPYWRRQRPLEGRACVWHTLVIPAESEKYVSAGVSTYTGAAAERREHWVKAHRRRITKGGIRQLIFLKEYKRGNPELGIVIPEIVLQGDRHA